MPSIVLFLKNAIKHWYFWRYYIVVRHSIILTTLILHEHIYQMLLRAHTEQGILRSLFMYNNFLILRSIRGNKKVIERKPWGDGLVAVDYGPAG